MAEVLLSFDGDIFDGAEAFHARAVGRQAQDGRWEGWLEFVPARAGDAVLITRVETTQPEHAHLAYWASGLSKVYLEGALRRARTPAGVQVRAAETAASEAPAPKAARGRAAAAAPATVLDPFDVGGRSLDILDQELRALNRPRLLNIIDGYKLNPGSDDLAWMSDPQLVRFIVVAVETQLPQRTR